MIRSLIVIVLATAGATAQNCDPTAIRWHLPGTFEEAWKRAKAENRMLLIKGISFGIDDAGASCATKGRW